MKKSMGVKIFAAIALFGIAIGIVGTGVLFIFQSNTSYPQEIQLTEAEIQELIQAQQESASGSIEESTLSEVLEEGEVIQDQDTNGEDFSNGEASENVVTPE